MARGDAEGAVTGCSYLWHRKWGSNVKEQKVRAQRRGEIEVNGAKCLFREVTKCK